MFLLGYNTNGLPFHRLDDALELVAELGYGAIAITPDVGALDPLRLAPQDVEQARAKIDDLGLAVAIETGARFVLDPRRKHRPTLLEDSAADRERRVDFYRRSIDLAVSLGAGVVSLWSGAAPIGAAGTIDEDPEHPLLDRLCDGLVRVLEHAQGTGVRVAFEPEPGMLVERPRGFDRVCQRLGAAGDELGLTLDVGHCVVTGDEPVSAVMAEFAQRLIHVHLDDCPRGEHSHVPFGQGDLDLSDALNGLLTIEFDGIAAVELSRDGHRGVDAATEALATLRSTLTEF